MAQRNPSGKDRRERILVNGLWIAAGGVFVAGAALRLVASLVTRADIRIAGVMLLAAGAVIGVIGWVSERYIFPRAR
jgi:hypothetical protein